MDQKPNMIKEDIEETRAHLAGKLNDLEDELRGRVETAKDKIRQLNPRHQISSYPLAALGGSLVAGLAAGYLISGRRHAVTGGRQWTTEDVESGGEFLAELPQASDDERTPSLRERWQLRQPNALWQKLNETFSEEIQLVKGMAIGAVTGAARDAVKQLAPKLSPQIDKLAQSVNHKFGVKEHEPVNS